MKSLVYSSRKFVFINLCLYLVDHCTRTGLIMLNILLGRKTKANALLQSDHRILSTCNCSYNDVHWSVYLVTLKLES